ncbi:hypothetical protein TorRG33x02_227540, partial [Trema orientale]
SKIFYQVEKIKSDGGGAGKTAGYVRLGSKFSTTVERRSKFSTGGFDPSRTFSTPVEHFRLESKLFSHWSKNDRNNRERWSNAGRNFRPVASTLVELFDYGRTRVEIFRPPSSGGTAAGVGIGTGGGC